MVKAAEGMWIVALTASDEPLKNELERCSSPGHYGQHHELNEIFPILPD